jgi:hypothetical protein
MAAGCALPVTRTRGPQEFLTEPSVLWAEPGDAATLAAQQGAAATRPRGRASHELAPLYARPRGRADRGILRPGAGANSLIPKNPAPDLIGDGYRFSDKIMLK